MLLLSWLALSCTKETYPTELADTDPGTASHELCDNGSDDDDDGLADCDDPDCAEHPQCEAPDDEDCANGIDDDGDGDTDCADTDCVDDPACIPESELDCTDGADDDRDGLTDCADPDCTDACDEVCDNGVDDDADELVDCLDDECTHASVCIEVCDDGVDNDQDGFMDCEDADCYGVGPCAEDCTDGTDNDRDGHADCDDSDCWGTTDCLVRSVVVTSGHLQTTHTYSAGVFYSAGHYSYSSAVSQEIWASGVTGRFVYAWGSATTSCTWSVSYAHLTAQYNMRYDPGYGVRTGGSRALSVLQRDGFTTTGCAGSAGTSAFPTSFALTPTALSWVGSSYSTTSSGRPVWRFHMGQWYGGSALELDSTYRYSDLSGPGVYHGVVRSTFNARGAMSSGAPWAF